MHSYFKEKKDIKKGCYLCRTLYNSNKVSYCSLNLSFYALK